MDRRIDAGQEVVTQAQLELAAHKLSYKLFMKHFIYFKYQIKLIKHMISNGDILTYCDLNIGHIDIHSFILVNPRVANSNTTVT